LKVSGKEEPEFLVFPNPAGAEAEVVCQSEILRLEITDVLGVTRHLSLFTANGAVRRARIDLSALPGGVYFIVLNDSGRKMIRKLVVK
jgi:hypothetical protein